MSFNFRGIVKKLVPWWLAGDEDEGHKVHWSLAFLADAALERLRLGIRARFPSDAPEDALAFIGRDRRIVRGFAESSDNYRARLPGFLDVWRRAGSPWPMMEQLRAYVGLTTGMVTRTVDNRGNWFTIDTNGEHETPLLDQGNWDWDSQPTLWARFWPILYPPSSLWEAGPVIGDPDLWDGEVGADGFTIGSTATPEQVAAVKHIVRELKPAGTRGKKIIIAFDPDDFDPTDNIENPDGDWDDPTQRDPNARYWNPNT